MQVERQATQQRAPVGLGRVMQPQLAMLRQDERVDRRANPIRVDRRYLRTRKGSKRPPRARLAFIGQCDVRRPRRRPRPNRESPRHPPLTGPAALWASRAFRPRCSRPAGSRPASQARRRAALAAGKRRRRRDKRQAPFRFLSAVTRDTAPLENRRHHCANSRSPGSIEGSITGSARTVPAAASAIPRIKPRRRCIATVHNLLPTPFPTPLARITRHRKRGQFASPVEYEADRF